MRNAMSAARRDGIPGPDTTSAACTKAGEVRLRVPKLRQQTFETAIIERYRRRESSVEEALIEMYLAGVSVRQVEVTAPCEACLLRAHQNHNTTPPVAIRITSVHKIAFVMGG